MAEECFNVAEGPASQLLLQMPCCRLLLLLLLTLLAVCVFTACPADQRDTTEGRLQSTSKLQVWVLHSRVLWRCHLVCDDNHNPEHTQGRLDDWHMAGTGADQGLAEYTSHLVTHTNGAKQQQFCMQFESGAVQPECIPTCFCATAPWQPASQLQEALVGRTLPVQQTPACNKPSRPLSGGLCYSSEQICCVHSA